MKIKICGLFRPEDITYVNAAQPDYIGFVFAESRRRVSPKQAEAMKQNLNPLIQTVGVFVNAPVDDVAGLMKNGIIDLAQLHGSEDEAYIHRLRSMVSGKIIKAVRVETSADIQAAQAYPVDFLLLDHGAGGTGKAFDWSLVQECGKPYFLAGGIDAGNLAQAMKTGNPYAVDISSGAETQGVKDENKIMELVRRVRNG